MAKLTGDDVMSLIRDVEAGLESAVRHPEYSTGGTGEPPHLMWGRGEHPMAVGVTPDGLEFRDGEYWAARYSDLEVSDEPWVVDSVESWAVGLRESMNTAAERKAKLARRASAPKRSTVDLLIAYLEAPDPDRFEKTVSPVALWVDHREEDDAVVLGVDRQLGGGIVSASWTSDGRLAISGPEGEQTVTPKSRDVTLRALTRLLGPKFELRYWIGGVLGDTVAVLALPADAWREVVAARSARALDAQFQRIHSRSKVFG